MKEFSLPDLPKGTKVKMSGNVDIHLPRYMTSLTRYHIDQVKRSSKNLSGVIIAVGYEPTSGDIMALTGDGRLIEINAEAHSLPPTHCIPTDHGLTVLFPDTRLEITAEKLIRLAEDPVIKIEGDIRC